MAATDWLTDWLSGGGVYSSPPPYRSHSFIPVLLITQKKTKPIYREHYVHYYYYYLIYNLYYITHLLSSSSSSWVHSFNFPLFPFTLISFLSLVFIVGWLLLISWLYYLFLLFSFIIWSHFTFIYLSIYLPIYI